MSFSLADIFRRLENLLCYATVAEVDNSAHLVRLTIGESKTGWLPYPTEIGANFFLGALPVVQQSQAEALLRARPVVQLM